jgi:hypothetical protein
MKLAFQKVDKDGSGTLDFSEVYLAIYTLTTFRFILQFLQVDIKFHLKYSKEFSINLIERKRDN